ncbi:prostaglandin reductase 1-like [Battus philenor]|uniref:prostaglandin reductase 1-like n=1 Tax=Battus philenor TaxID=42288 RepID=UPI0035D13309
MKAKKYVVKNYFKGLPKREDYELVEYELPPLQDGEILIKTEWISVDPYLRAYNSSNKIPYDQFGFQVGTVQESKNPKFPVGAKVVTHKGWCDYTIAKEGLEDRFSGYIYKLPNLDGLSPSLAIGAIGMPGITAYYGFLDICKPKAGETVVVTGAAGAVGSIVGQIAKIKGCKVIGFAGSDDKVQWLEEELGFDKAINYKTADVSKALKEAAPNGVDCYFDNVGGEISSIIINQMNTYGRVSVCGSISAYNEDASKLPKATILQPALVFKQISVRGFLIWEWFDGKKEVEAIAQLTQWIKSGQIKVKEHVTKGFENLFDAFIGMLAGENTGKAVVKV